jgi:hypothetical protein
MSMPLMHVGREPYQVAPYKRGQENESLADDDAVSPEHSCLGRHEIDNPQPTPSPRCGRLSDGLLADPRLSSTVGAFDAWNLPRVTHRYHGWT